MHMYANNKKIADILPAIFLVIRVGFEPTTPSLKGMCSTS